jgi:hypothetical protein
MNRAIRPRAVRNRRVAISRNCGPESGSMT